MYSPRGLVVDLFLSFFEALYCLFFLLFYSFHVENVMHSLLFYVCPRSPGLATTYNKWMVKEPLSDLGVSSLSQFQNGVV